MNQTVSIEDTDMKNHILCGRNPIREALKSGRDMEKILIQRGELSGSAREIVQTAKSMGVMIQETDKTRLDEITKINLYDIGLSEEELKRRKAKKYELKKALKGCTYGDVNDKKYVKELIYDLLSKEYGVDETNISKAIPFDTPSLLTPQDKFEIIIHEYKYR